MVASLIHLCYIIGYPRDISVHSFIISLLSFCAENNLDHGYPPQGQTSYPPLGHPGYPPWGQMGFPSPFTQVPQQMNPTFSSQNL
jgi:hypothetical protein